MRLIKLVWTLMSKDLTIEYRSRQAFLTTVFFALLILIIFNFAFDPGDNALREAAPGVLWVSLLFPGVIQLNRSFQSEREEGTLHGLILSPVDRSTLFLGKFLANTIILQLVDILILGAFFIFYNVTLSPRLLWLLLLMLLVGIVFSAVGTLFAAMVSGIRTRDVLLPILLFPILVPMVVAAVNATRELMGPGELQFFFDWVKLLAASDVVFVAGAFIVFEFVVEE